MYITRARRTNKGVLTKFDLVLLFLFFMVDLNQIFAKIQVIQWAVWLLIIFRCFSNKKIHISQYLVYCGLFTSLVGISVFWAYNASSVTPDIRVMIKTLAVMVFLCNKLRTMQDIYKVMLLIVSVTTINDISVMPSLLMKSAVFTTDGRLIIMLFGQSLNINFLAPNSGFSFFYALILVFGIDSFIVKKKYIPIAKFLLLFCCAVFVYTIIMCASRSAMLLVIVSSIAFLYAKTNGSKRVIIIGGSVIVLIIAYEFLITNTALYNAAGWRIEQLINMVTKKQSSRSDSLRLSMVSNGLQMFLDRPIIGYGAANFKNVNAALYSDYHYAHNNYIEVLVDFGIVGFLLYYARFVSIIKQARHHLPRHTIERAIVFSIIVMGLTFDISIVSYNILQTNVAVAIAYCITEIVHNQSETMGKGVAYE